MPDEADPIWLKAVSEEIAAVLWEHDITAATLKRAAASAIRAYLTATAPAPPIAAEQLEGTECRRCDGRGEINSLVGMHSDCGGHDVEACPECYGSGRDTRNG